MKDAKRRGRLRLPDADRLDALNGLLRCYDAHAPFIQELTDLLAEHASGFSRLAALVWRGPLSKFDPRGYTVFDTGDPGYIGPIRVWWVHLQSEAYQQAEASEGAALGQLLRAAESLAQRWGLEAPWGAPLVLQQAFRAAVGIALRSGNAPQGVSLPPWLQDYDRRIDSETKWRPHFGPVGEAVTFNVPYRILNLGALLEVVAPSWLPSAVAAWLRRWSPQAFRIVEEEIGGERVLTERSPLHDHPFELPVEVDVSASAIVLHLRYEPLHESREDFEKRALAKLRAEMDAVEQAWEAVAERQDTRTELERHSRWLFLRVCPQKPGANPLGWAAIAKRECAAVRTIRQAVEGLANAIGIALPRLTEGRPRKYPD